MMNPRLALYAAWCAVLAAVTIYASLTAWSPFSDEEKQAHSSVYVRPTHK